MKRKLSLFLVLCMMLSAFVSCSKDQNDPADTTGTASGSETQASTDTDAPEEEFVPHYEYTPSIVADPDFYFVENGASDYVIVYRENADNATNYNMALELQSYIEKITDVQLPLVTDETEAVDHEIVIGLTNREEDGQFDRAALTDQGFEIDVRESGKVFIAGGDDLGTKYGVYHFVDEYLGCGLYSPEYEYIPDYDSLGLAYGEDIQVPALIGRTIGCRKFYSYFDKMKLGGHTVHAGHTLPYIVFGNYGSNDPCLSLEETYQTVLNYVLDTLEENPDTYSIGIGQADNKNGYCTCDTCLSSYEQYGYSGHYIKFLNRVADAIKDEHPNTLLCTFAYQFTVAPPTGGVVPAENVAIQFCTIECCLVHERSDYNYGTEFSEYKVPNDSTFGEILNTWSTLCEKLAIYDYTPNYSAYNCITPNIHDQLSNIRMYAESNAPYVYIAGPTLSEIGEFDELRSYLVSKALWDPYMTEEEYLRYMNKFLCEYYGPGWEYIRAFIDLAEEKNVNCQYAMCDIAEVFPIDTEYLKSLADSVDLSTLTVEQIKDPASVDWDLYCGQVDESSLNFNEVLAKGCIYFAKADELAQTDEQRAHIDQSSIQLDVNYSTLIYANKTLPKAELLKQIYNRALKTYIDNGAIEEFDSYTYFYKFDDLVCEPIYKEAKTILAEFNRSLYHKMLKYGIMYLYESVNNFEKVSEEALDFSNPPSSGHGTPYTAWYPDA